MSISAGMLKSTEPKLEIYTLGRFSLKYGPKIMPEKRGGSNIWELFKYLLTNRNKRFFPEDVLETLWPDREYADPKAVFRYHVHRIRRALAQNLAHQNAIKIVSSHGCYALETKDNCLLDADEFETLSQKASEQSKHHINRAIDLYYRAVSLYRGEYLPEVTGNWVLPARNHYRFLFLKSALELIELLKHSQRHREILEVCQNVFLVEPLEEDFHIHFIETLLKEGKKLPARNHYQYITSLMYRELGDKPSPAMQKLYRLIMEGPEKIAAGFSHIQVLLQPPKKNRGALFCNPDYLQFLLEREKRRAERENTRPAIGLLTLSVPDSSPLPNNRLEEAAGLLERVLADGLRSSDVISRWNQTRFILFLPGIQVEQLEIILQRIKKQFQQAFNGKEIALQSSVHPIFP